MKFLRFTNIYIMKMKFSLMFYIIIGILSSLIGLTLPYISSKIIDTLVYTKSMDIIIKICLLMTILGVIGLLFGYIQSILGATLHLKANFKLNTDIIKHIQKSKWSYYSTLDTSYLNQRINNDSNNIVGFTLSLYADCLNNIITLIFSSIMLISIDKNIFFIALALSVINITVYFIFKKKLYKASIKQKENENDFFSNLFEQLDKVKFIKLNSLYDWFIHRLDKSFNKCLDSTLYYEKVSNVFMSITMLTSILSQVVLFIFGCYKVINGSITIGTYTIIVSYFNNLKGALSYFISVTKLYQENKVSFDRIRELLDCEIESLNNLTVSDIESVTISDIKFNYGQKVVFNGLYSKFEKGKIYCILGKNGAGKSTLRDILLGLYNNEFNGEILFNNHNINSLNMMKVRKDSIGITEQEPVILNDTLYNNLTLDKDIDTDHIHKLSKILNLDKYILSDNLQLSRSIDNSKVSGGEKQKISLLRTILRDPNIMILDEPTSAMDIESKKLFIDYLKSIKKEKIIIIISHDDEVIEFADELIEIELESSLIT